MGAGFSITIKAVDSATARIDAINKRLAAMRAPAERLSKTISTFTRLSGIDKVASGFSRIGRNAYSAIQSVARIVAPLGLISGAASVAGMYRLVAAWSEWGTQLGFASTRIGITVGQLQAFQGAATLVGVSSSVMTGGLQALGQSMYDAIGGRAPATVALFNQLGIAFDDGTRHARNVNAVLPEIADRIKEIRDPFTQARVAAQLFGGAAEELLPFLRLGSAGIAEYQAKARAYGVTTDDGVAAANRFRMAQAGLTLAVQGLGNSIAERLSPILSPLLDQMANWIALNRNWIATGIGKRVQEFADWVSHIDFKAVLADLTGVWHMADGVAQAFGGWKTVLEGIVAIKLAGWAFSAIAPFTTVLRLLALIPGSGVTAAALATAGIGAVALSGAGIGDNDPSGPRARFRVPRPPVGATGNPLPGAPNIGGWINRLFGNSDSASGLQRGNDAATAMRAFRNLGYSQAAAAGLSANLMAESGLRPDNVGDGGAAYGIGQWHADRQAYFKKLFGHDIRKSTLGEQLKFVDAELHSTEGNALRRLQEAQTPFDAGAAVSRFYERPAAADEAANNRGRLADQIASAAGADGVAGPSGKAAIHITVAGAGVEKVIAKTSGNLQAPKVMTTQVGTESGA